MENLKKNFQDLGCTVLSADHGKGQEVQVLYISNPDGSVRWFWPQSLRQPLFLKFYNVQGAKAKLFNLFVQCIFSCGAQGLVFKKGSVLLEPKNGTHLIDFFANNWAVFTGTVGPNRKYIFYKKEGNDAGVFTKIATSAQGALLLNNEQYILKKLSEEAPQLCIPQLLASEQQTITVSENSKFVAREAVWTPHHSAFLKGLQCIEAKTMQFSEFDTALQLSARIAALQQVREKLPSGIVKKLGYLLHSLRDTKLDTHLAHADFTPWNMYANAHGEMYVYDWELACAGYPKAFDYFHFMLQNGVLTQRKNWVQLRKLVVENNTVCSTEQALNHYLSLYLLVNVLNYLEVYEKQKDWHVQIYWLLEVWSQGMSDMLANVTDQRKLLVLDVFDYLHFQNYAGLKLPHKIEELSAYSDIDILMKKDVANGLFAFLKTHPLVSSVHTQTGIAMDKCMVLTHSNDVLSIDAIHQLKRKWLVYQDVDTLLNRSSRRADAIRHVNDRDTAIFLGLFYGLNHAKIPSKYMHFGQALHTTQHAIEEHVKTAFDLKLNQKQLNIEIGNLPENKGFSKIKHMFGYLIDTIKGALHQQGMIITFSGVDGAGKSTIIEQTKLEIEKKLRKRVVVIRHRPSVLPILSAWTKGKQEAEKSAAQTLPRQGSNKSVLSSLFRFLYYYADYVFGQFYIQLRYVMRGDIVLYDRYYFDFINDSLRSNITLPKWFLKRGYDLLLQPNLNFFLYADAKTILSRKKELDEATIGKLTTDYLSLFKDLNKNNKQQRYEAIENIDLSETLQLIFKRIQAKLV